MSHSDFGEAYKMDSQSRGREEEGITQPGLRFSEHAHGMRHAYRGPGKPAMDSQSQDRLRRQCEVLFT